MTSQKSFSQREISVSIPLLGVLQAVAFLVHLVQYGMLRVYLNKCCLQN